MLPHQSDTGVQSAEVSVTTTCTGDRSEVSNLTTENNDYGAEIAVAKIYIISPVDNYSRSRSLRILLTIHFVIL
jgi:hypothetical protein